MDHAAYYKRGPRKNKKLKLSTDIDMLEGELDRLVEGLEVADQVRRLHEDPALQKLMEDGAAAGKRVTRKKAEKSSGVKGVA